MPDLPPISLDLECSLERLPNGLLAAVVRQPGVPIVTLDVTYDVGSRVEVPGRTGLAHLFEHLMFEGSENVPKGDHFRLVADAGGVTNGTTSEDRTNYFETLPVESLDLALYLIARSAGVDVAMQVARINLIDWHAIGQQPFARLARSRQVEDGAIAKCQTWIADHYRDPAPVAAMARLSGLAERSFKRRFQQATGMSPLAYVHTLRLEEAKQMLEATDESIEAIANEVGYEDAGFFSRLFRREVNMSPAHYRKRFGAMRKALAGRGAVAG